MFVLLQHHCFPALDKSPLLITPVVVADSRVVDSRVGGSRVVDRGVDRDKELVLDKVCRQVDTLVYKKAGKAGKKADKEDSKVYNMVYNIAMDHILIHKKDSPRFHMSIYFF